ncbi:hypothetical protein ACFE04_027285 [Oxalis oulophora]
MKQYHNKKKHKIKSFVPPINYTFTPIPITPPPPKSTPTSAPLTEATTIVPPARTVVTSPPTSSVDVSPPHTMDTSIPSSSAHISTPPTSADSTGHYTSVCTSWTKVPKPHRDMWFIEFQDVYTWKREETYAIRKVWESRGSDIMRSLMTYSRSVRKQPEWIGLGIWEELLKKWDGKRDTGEDPEFAGTFKKLNSKTTKDGEEDSFNKNFNAWSNGANDDDYSSSDDEPPDEYEVWMEENEQSVINSNLRKDIEEIKKANVQPHPNPHYYSASRVYYAGPGYYYPPSRFPAPPNRNAPVQPIPPGYHSEASHSAPPGFHLPFIHQTSQPSLPPHSFTNLLANNQPFSEPRTSTNLLANKQPSSISLSGESDNEGRGERLGYMAPFCEDKHASM